MTIQSNDIRDRIKQIFIHKYGSSPLLVRSPGRINIIGEHTDYNEGFVLPAAIDKSIYVAVAKRNDNRIELYSVDYNDSFETSIDEIKPTKNWATYILGIAGELQAAGFAIGGFNLIIDGNIPIGAGLSSSAAIESAVVFALNELFEIGLSKMDMVLLAQKAEHNYAGVMCGIMDMFVSILGKKDHVIKLDCRSLEYTYLPLDLQDCKIVLINTNVKHSLASSAYNERTQQCQQGVKWVKALYPEANSLRDVTIEMLKKCVQPKDELIFSRCLFVLEENMRLQRACKYLEQGNIEQLGKLMFQTHNGLSNLYEVSCKESDYLINAVKNDSSVLGARMMGGGFGGCTINIIKSNSADQIIEKLAYYYKKDMQITLSAHFVKLESGTELLKV